MLLLRASLTWSQAGTQGKAAAGNYSKAMQCGSSAALLQTAAWGCFSDCCLLQSGPDSLQCSSTCAQEWALLQDHSVVHTTVLPIILTLCLCCCVAVCSMSDMRELASYSPTEVLVSQHAPYFHTACISAAAYPLTHRVAGLQLVRHSLSVHFNVVHMSHAHTVQGTKCTTGTHLLPLTCCSCLMCLNCSAGLCVAMDALAVPSARDGQLWLCR